MSSIGAAGSGPSNIPEQLPPDVLDFKKDGTITSNDEPISLKQANAKLAALDLETDGVDIRTKGGAGTGPVSDKDSHIVAGGDPYLPDVGGSSAAASAVGSDVSNLSSYDDGGTAALMWEAMSEMAKTSRQDMKIAGELRNAMQASKIQNQKAAIGAEEQKLEAERDAAVVNFVGQVAAAFVAGGAGGMLKGSGLGSQALQTMGTAASAGFTAYSKNAGPQRTADDKKLEGMRLKMMETIDDQAIEGAKTNYEDAKEAHKQALRVLTETAERMTQVIQKITS